MVGEGAYCRHFEDDKISGQIQNRCIGFPVRHQFVYHSPKTKVLPSRRAVTRRVVPSHRLLRLAVASCRRPSRRFVAIRTVTLISWLDTRRTIGTTRRTIDGTTRRQDATGDATARCNAHLSSLEHHTKHLGNIDWKPLRLYSFGLIFNAISGLRKDPGPRAPGN